MWNIAIFLAFGLIAAGLFWGVSLAFERSAATGILTILAGPSWIPIFLLVVRPEGYRKPLRLLIGGLTLALFAGALQ